MHFYVYYDIIKDIICGKEGFELMSTLYICQQCGGSLDILENGLGECQYCGVLQTLPIDQSKETKNILNRAIEFRLNCDFDRAIYEYEKALDLNETEPETHWGMLLSKYGVEYVKDPITYVYKPTLHRISSISIFDDIDYKAAIKYALPSQISYYKEKAEEIEAVMKELLMMSANQEPYDIFLSYKEADDVTRKRTDDSYLAHDLYNELTAQGYKVFFAPKSLGIGLYEPKIYSAIISSKIMIVLGTKAEYFNAVWVKNEWSRYAEMIDRGEPKEIIPVYKNMEVDKLPYKLTRYQAYDMSSISFLPMLLDTISTIVSKSKTKIKFNKDVSAEDNFIERGRLELEAGHFTEAERFIESALNINAHNSQAYFYKLMIEMRITKQEYISTSTKYLKEYINFERAVNFADHELKMTLLKYEEQVKKSLDTQNYSILINSLKDASSKENLVEISEKLKKYKHIDQSNNFIEKIDNCIKEISSYEEKNYR